MKLRSLRNATHAARLVVCAPLLAMALALGGCDEKLTGTYEEAQGDGTLEFRDDRVYVTLAIVGTTIAADYELDGDKVIVKGSGGSQVFTIRNDGSLAGDMGMHYVKRGS